MCTFNVHIHNAVTPTILVVPTVPLDPLYEQSGIFFNVKLKALPDRRDSVRNGDPLVSVNCKENYVLCLHKM